MFADFHGHSHILGITLLGCDAAASEVKQDPVLHAATSCSRASQKFFADHSEPGTRVVGSDHCLFVADSIIIMHLRQGEDLSRATQKCFTASVPLSTRLISGFGVQGTSGRL